MSATTLPDDWKMPVQAWVPHVVTDGRFGGTPAALLSARSLFAAVRRTLDEPDLKAGTLEGRTAAAVIGARRRVVHIDYVDPMDHDPGSILKMGDAGGALLELRLCGPMAPAMDLDDPVRGMRRALDMARTLLSTPIAGFDLDIECVLPVWRDGAGILLADVVGRRGDWGPGSKVDVRYETPLAPFSMHTSLPGVTRRQSVDLSPMTCESNPARRLPGTVTLRCHENPEGMVSILLKAASVQCDHDEVDVPDAMGRLRRAVAIKRLLA